MKRIFLTAAISLVAAGTAYAEGDAAAGETDFKKCKACHSIIDDSGEVIVKGGKVGPNLFGVIGRQAGTYPDFSYGDSIVAAGEAGLVWTEDEIITYAHDPKTFLKDYLGDDGAKSKMTFKLKDATDVAAYLATFSPAMDDSDMDGDSDAAEGTDG